MRLNEVIGPDEEDLYWKNPKIDDLWALDKLILSKKLGYTCGPAGIEVPKEGIYNNNREKTLLPCAETDYREAQKGELPARWWKSVQRSMI